MIGRLKKWCRDKKSSYRLYCSMTDIVPVSRRYFIVGFFDGVLTIQGMILGAYLSGKSTTIGLYMGKVSRTNILISGLRLLLAGVVTLIVVTILNPSHIS